jgi:hypothetical protein
VTQVPGGAKQVRLWIPVPLDTPDQTIGKLMFQAKSGDVVNTSMGEKPGNLKDGGQGGLKWSFHDVGGGFGRSVCLESAGTPIDVELAFDVTRYESKGGGKATPAELAALKQPNKMIPLDGKVAAVAASLKLPADPKAAARALYDHTLERMKYDKPDGDKGWGHGDAEWACDAKFGNCTDFHSYFMGLARSKGMAARFEMGFPVPGGDEKESKVGGYHCWAYVWIEGHGWLPVDISEADKHGEKADSSSARRRGPRDHDWRPRPHPPRRRGRAELLRLPRRGSRRPEGRCHQELQAHRPLTSPVLIQPESG